MKKEPLGGEILTDVTDTEHTCIEASTLDNALVMIVVLEENGRIISWNHAAETITGYSADEVVGHRDIWKHLYPDPQYRHSVTEKISGVILRPIYFENRETTVVTKNQEKRIISWNTRQIEFFGKIHVIVTERDITEQRREEESLVAYMTEMTLRLKHPVEIISNNLLGSAQLVRQGILTQVGANIQELKKGSPGKKPVDPGSIQEIS